MRISHRSPIIALLVVIAIGALAGCMNHEAPLSPVPQTARFSTAVGPAQLAFIERTYDADADATTFRYQLQNTAAPESPVDGVLGVFTNVTLEVPACAGTLGSASPPDGASLGTTVLGFNGVTWGVGYDVNPDYYYSVTFPGNIPAGTVRGLVSTGGMTYIQQITGPCEDGYQVAGTVFTDANANGTIEGNEFGVENITVTLSSGGEDDVPQTVKTDSEGNYIFVVAVEGTYTVSITSPTADATDFNETLFQIWSPTTPTSLEVTIGPDSADNDFGFEPNVDNIITGIDTGDYPTDGKSYKWWRKEFLRVINGNTNTAYTQAQLLTFAHAIEDLALLDEYDWTPGSELVQIYNILNNHAFVEGDGVSEIEVDGKYNGQQDPYFDLLRELLTTELNHVSGRGLEDSFLQEVLVNWGEGILDNNPPAEASTTTGSVILKSGTGGPQRAYETPIEGAKLFGKINGATGGGGTN